MAKSARKKSPARKAGAAKRAASGTPTPAKARKSAATRAAEEFVRGAVARGEAVRPGRKGKLPPGATHEIVGEDETGLPKLRRRRFSLA